MNDTVKEDLMKIFEETVESLDRCPDELSEISNHTIHNASIFQDEDSISAAVIVYALSKIVQRKGRLDPKIRSSLLEARDNLKEGRLGEYSKNVKEIIQAIRDRDKELKRYIQEVFNEAEIKKGSKLYDQGISLSRASHLLNVSQWELMSYVGKTRINDRDEPEDDRLKERIASVKEIFGLR